MYFYYCSCCWKNIAAKKQNLFNGEAEFITNEVADTI